MRDKCFAVVVLVLLFSSCSNPATKTVSTEPSPAASAQPVAQSTPRNDFEEALRFVRNGQFTYIWVFARKDGKPFGPEDSAILKARASQIVDFALTDDKKKGVAGSNFPFEERNLAELQKRYVIENYSAK